MIIGVSGKIGSGKDLVGRIIQYLTSTRTYEKSFIEWEDLLKNPGQGRWYAGYCNWKIKKYADKLKDIVCILIGCTREQLEDRVFKETELGPEWWYYKGEVGIYPYNTPYEANKKLPLIKLTPRMLFQEIGTDLFRNQLHPNAWINATMAEYQPISGTMDVRRSKETFPNWIVTDVRFPNEANAIKDREGILIRVNRFKIGQTIWWEDPEGFSSGTYIINNLLEDFCEISNTVSEAQVPYHEIKDSSINQHESETALDDYEFDYVIDNNGTIEELIVKIKNILIERGIL